MNRKIITPLTIGVFLVMAVTGFLMFFHWNTGMNKLAHEWIGMLMIVVIALHVALNFKSFKRYFSDTAGRLIMAAFAILLALTFVISPSKGGREGGGSPVKAMMDTMSHASIAQIAELKDTDSQALLDKLEQAGYQDVTENQTIEEIAGGNRGATGKVLNLVLAD